MIKTKERCYHCGGRFLYHQAEPVIDPKTGKVLFKKHPLGEHSFGWRKVFLVFSSQKRMGKRALQAQEANEVSIARK